MRKLFVFLFLATSLVGFAQIKFEPGYYVDNNGNRVEGLIKNIDWMNNPTSFLYKADENAKSENILLGDAQEFSILNKSKYERHKVNVDISSDKLQNMTSDSLPIYKEEMVFLKLLVDGKAKLYTYYNNQSKFFYQKEDKEIIPLVYKKYIKENSKVSKENGNIATNDSYKRQLWMDVSCNTDLKKRIKYLEYKIKPLTKYFQEYNNCEGDEIQLFEKKKDGNNLHLSLRPQVSISTFDFDNSVSNESHNLGSKVGFGVGVELEYTLPFNNKKWSLIVEPTFKNVNFKEKGEVEIKMNYNSFELPFGVRYYFFINDKSRIFINASYQFNFASSTSIKFSKANTEAYKSLDVKSANNAVFGIGYKYDRFSVEYRVSTKRDVLKDYSYWDSSYGNMSFILGYSFF
ncbi:hypothetical protein HMPREF9711_02011 [Myroides odoratimimus CCUG 3837]|uniref:outer membrane beta-barrel protein n=1 Tax=Myroides odoratimimus TaxID=76832 RepID=UPI000280AC1F|nr:outer membrane beta-barrel protein [Myroides odoratimimus]EKB04159.1 hypothetical protein HMPREF9711_02011 [Myroides odoratimimus CCUG 3837]